MLFLVWERKLKKYVGNEVKIATETNEAQTNPIKNVWSWVTVPALGNDNITLSQTALTLDTQSGMWGSSQWFLPHNPCFYKGLHFWISWCIFIEAGLSKHENVCSSLSYQAALNTHSLRHTHTHKLAHTHFSHTAAPPSEQAFTKHKIQTRWLSTGPEISFFSLQKKGKEQGRPCSISASVRQRLSVVFIVNRLYK